MGWWIFWGTLLLILLLPIGASLFYDAAGVRVLVIAGPVRFTVFPSKKKDQKKSSEKTEKQDPKKETSDPVPTVSKLEKTVLPEAPKPPQPQEEKGGSLIDFLPLV